MPNTHQSLASGVEAFAAAQASAVTSTTTGKRPSKQSNSLSKSKKKTRTPQAMSPAINGEEEEEEEEEEERSHDPLGPNGPERPVFRNGRGQRVAAVRRTCSNALSSCDDDTEIEDEAQDQVKSRRIASKSISTTNTKADRAARSDSNLKDPCPSAARRGLSIHQLQAALELKNKEIASLKAEVKALEEEKKVKFEKCENFGKAMSEIKRLRLKVKSLQDDRDKNEDKITELQLKVDQAKEELVNYRKIKSEAVEASQQNPIDLTEDDARFER